jgi:hypothetical protein
LARTYQFAFGLALINQTHTPKEAIMSARVLPKGLQNIGSGSIAFLADEIRARLVKLDGTLTDTAVKAITGVTNADPAVYTVASTSGWTTGDICVVLGVLGNLSANQTGVLQVINGTTFSLQTEVDGIDVAGSGAYTSGGCVVNLTLITNRDDYDTCEVGTISDALANKTNVDGVYDADDPSSMTLADTAHAFFLHKVVGAAATDLPFLFQDGKITVKVAADAASSATTIWVEPLDGPIDDTTVIYFSNGASATLTAAAAAGDRTLTVSALAAGIDAGNQADVLTSGGGFPISSGGGPVSPSFSATGNKICHL